MGYDNEVEGYVKPTEAQIKARGRRNLAIGGALLAFCILIFLLMIVKIGGAA